jgi:AraC-like DNA-binding protein
VPEQGTAAADQSNETLRPTITLVGARASYVGPGLNLAPHRNAAATLAIALEVPFTLELLDARVKTGVVCTSVAFLPPGTRHHLRTKGEMAFVYLDALSDDLRQLSDANLVSAQARLRAERPEVLRGWDAEDWCAALGVPRRIEVDGRIADVVRCIDEHPQSFARLADAARLASLSPTRFHSLFRQAVGMPFRRYRLWRRMAVAVRGISDGQTLTNAALDAGFSSSAHFSTSFRAMFGLTPSSLGQLAPRIVHSGKEARLLG